MRMMLQPLDAFLGDPPPLDQRYFLLLHTETLCPFASRAAKMMAMQRLGALEPSFSLLLRDAVSQLWVYEMLLTVPCHRAISFGKSVS